MAKKGGDEKIGTGEDLNHVLEEATQGAIAHYQSLEITGEGPQAPYKDRKVVEEACRRMAANSKTPNIPYVPKVGPDGKYPKDYLEKCKEVANEKKGQTKYLPNN